MTVIARSSGFRRGNLTERLRNGASRLLASSAVTMGAVALVMSACDSKSPTQPQTPPTPPKEVSGTITFANAAPDAPIATYTESGFVVQFRSSTWRVIGPGFHDAFPFFMSERGASAVGTIQITANGSEFVFKSVDVYSSLTPIPYTVVGTRGVNKQIDFGDTLPFAGVVGNTFGNFRTVTNPSPGQLIDTLTITLTNPALEGGGNPMGLDTIVLTR